MPICYPYIRFSSMKQADGDSIRRQAARIDEFVQRHKLSIDTRLEDHGVSSFRGKNVKSGQLAGFLQRVRDGEIDKGSYLLIENWDRLSRQVLDASLELFSDLIRAGIKIAVLDEGTVYDDLTSNSYIRAIVHFERAHDESLRKSDMSKANWKAKHREMEKGVIVTKKIPNWLKIENDSFVVIEDIAEQIREMFKLSLAYGLSEVGRMLNERYDSKWKTHQIQYMLKNKRVIGWHVPVVYSKENGKNITTDSLFADYYPPIIEADIFDQVQTIIKSRKPFSGRSDIQKFNIYRDLIVCSECGGNVRFMLKKSQNGDKEYYYCTNSMSDACTTKGLKSVRGEHLRKVLFKYEHWTNISSFFSQHDHATKALKSESALIKAKLEQLLKKISKLEQSFAHEADEEIAETYISLLTNTRKQKKSLELELTSINQKIATYNAAYDFKNEGVAQEFESVLTDKSEKGAIERGKINRYLKTIFKRIEIDFKKMTLTTKVKEAFEGTITSVEASISIPVDGRKETPYPTFWWIEATRQQQIIKNIKARMRRKGLVPEHSAVKNELIIEAKLLMPQNTNSKKRLDGILTDKEWALLKEGAHLLSFVPPKIFID